MRRTIIMPPGAFFLILPIAFPPLVAIAGGLAVHAFATHDARWSVRVAPLLPYGLLLLAAGLHDLWAGLAFFAAYLANLGNRPARHALCPGAKGKGPHVIRQSHEYGAVVRWFLFMTLSVMVAGWSVALLDKTAPEVRRFAVMTLIATFGLLACLGASYVYRWGWSGDAVLRLDELPMLSGRAVHGEIVAAGLHYTDPSIAVFIRCKHTWDPEKNWSAKAECQPRRIPGDGLAIRFSVQLPRELDGAGTFGVGWSIYARSGDEGMLPNFYCIFSALPVFYEPMPNPFAMPSVEREGE